MTTRRLEPEEHAGTPRRLYKWVFRSLAVAVSCLIGVVLLESGLRITRERDRFYPFHPNAKRVFYPTPDVTPGIEGVSYFTTCSLGTRGPELDNSKYRMLVIGGSTTACTALNDDETWPELLRRYVNQRCSDRKLLWVTSSGVNGLNSRNHIMHAKYLVPRIPELDYVLVYAGLNDVGLWLYNPTFDPQYLDDPANWSDTLARSFRISNYVANDAPWYKHLEIWKRASVIKAAYQTAKLARQQQRDIFVEDERFQWLETAAQRRAERRKRFVPRAKMETLDTAIGAYQANLNRIVRLCREAGTEPIFMAQYIRWHGVSEDQRRRIWMGAMDRGNAYVRAEQMAELVDRFNAAMRQTAEAERVLFVDLPALLGEAGDLSYDGVHLNELGARMVAQSLADFLIQQDLFVPSALSPTATYVRPDPQATTRS